MSDSRRRASEELQALKKLVRKFLQELRFVPFRALDCDQKLVNALEVQLWDATKLRRRKKDVK